MWALDPRLGKNHVIAVFGCAKPYHAIVSVVFSKMHVDIHRKP